MVFILLFLFSFSFFHFPMFSFQVIFIHNFHFSIYFYRTDQPPSTISGCPVINDASSDAKNNTALATSSGLPIPGIKCNCDKSLTNCSLLLPSDSACLHGCE